MVLTEMIARSLKRSLRERLRNTARRVPAKGERDRETETLHSLFLTTSPRLLAAWTMDDQLRCQR